MNKGDVFYKRKDPHKYHIIARIVEADEPIYVIKFYGIYRKGWFYEVIEEDLFYSRLNLGMYSKTRLCKKRIGE